MTIPTVDPLAGDDFVAHFVPPDSLDPDEPLDPSAPQPYEWWYFELHFPGPAVDAQGAPAAAGAGVDDWVVVISCHLPHFFDPLRLVDVTLGRDSRGTGKRMHPPFAYSGAAISIYRCSPTEPAVSTLVGFCALRTKTATASTTRPFHARWGAPESPAITIDETLDHEGYTLKVDTEGWWASRGLVEAKFRGRRALPLEIDLDLRLDERSEGFKVNGGVLLHDRWGGRHHWVLRMPDPRVRGRVRLRADGNTMLDHEVDATGYHDHQWGPHMPMDVMKSWSWGRVLLAPDDRPGEQDLLVFFRSVPYANDPLEPGEMQPEGADVFAHVRHGQLARILGPHPGRDAVTLGGWDDLNYPLEGFDPAPIEWPPGRPAVDVTRALVPQRPRTGPPFFVPNDDSRPSILWWLAMSVGRPISRWRLKDTVGYWGAVWCDGVSDDGQRRSLLLTQRGTCIEPWPFYNRYLPAATTARDGQVRDRVVFALSEYLQVRELLSVHPPLSFAGRPVYTDLLGVALFSEMMTTIEPGAPRLRDMWGYLG